MKHPDFGLQVIWCAFLAAVSNLFAYCFCGKMATDSYSNMAECLYESNWHKLELKYQKYIIIMIANAQKPIYYHGFGIAVLNLETFNKVSYGKCFSFFNWLKLIIFPQLMRTVISYYMIFKALTSD